MPTIREIYEKIQALAPFENQQSWDNSGLLIGAMETPVRRILVALDITKAVALEAKANGVELVVAHHPVIFHGLKQLSPEHPAVILAAAGIGAICAHTNYDSAPKGMCLAFSQAVGAELLPGALAYDEGKPIGGFLRFERAYTAQALAELLKTKLGCGAVRFTDGGVKIRTAAICPGSGGEYLSAALPAGSGGETLRAALPAGSGGETLRTALPADCAALITGDVKQNQFADAENAGFTLMDAGHFGTEQVFCAAMRQNLREWFPEVDTQIGGMGWIHTV